jgi:hypothetical protein
MTTAIETRKKRAEEFLKAYVDMCGPLKTNEDTVKMLLAHEKAVREMIVDRLVSYEKMIHRGLARLRG